MHWDAKKIFQALPFYNTFIEKPKIKKLSSVELLKKLPFYDELKIAFQEIIYRLDNWISHGSGWVFEEIYNQYLNISTYNPLIGSTHIKLPVELQHPMRGLINIQNNDNKCFLWCHMRHLNLNGKKLQRIRKIDKKLLINLTIVVLIFLFQRNIILKLNY